MAGLIGLGRDYANSAKQGFGQLSAMEQQRNAANDQIKAQAKATRMSSVGAGAGLGMSVGGPWGAAIGAAVGLLASELF